MLKVYVADRLETSVILGCDLGDKDAKAIRPLNPLVELDDGTTVPIVRQPNKRLFDAPPFREEQE